jgi:hypothetical protein
MGHLKSNGTRPEGTAFLVLSCVNGENLIDKLRSTLATVS